MYVYDTCRQLNNNKIRGSIPPSIGGLVSLVEL